MKWNVKHFHSIQSFVKDLNSKRGVLREGTRGNRNFTHALCICWWQIRMATKLFPGGHPRCASETDGPNPHLRSSNRATSYLGVWWETHILALGTRVSVIYRSKWKLELWPDSTSGVLVANVRRARAKGYTGSSKSKVFLGFSSENQPSSKIKLSSANDFVGFYPEWFLTFSNMTFELATITKSHTHLLFCNPMTKLIVYTLVLSYPLLRKTKVCDKNAALGP